jgi:hypothetical protein
VAEARFDPVSDRFLSGHRLKGVPILPAVIGVEALAEAASTLALDRPVNVLRDVEIVNALQFHGDRRRWVDVRVRQTAAGLNCELGGPVLNRRGTLIDPYRPFARGRVEFGETPAQSPGQALGEPEVWHDWRYLDAQTAREEGVVFHGPSLRCLKRIGFGPEVAWGQIVAPPLADLAGDRAGTWLVPGAVLDACLVACAVFARVRLGTSQLPRAFRCLRLGRMPRPGERCALRADYRGRQGGDTCFDFVLVGENDEAILSVEGHLGAVISPR